MNKKCNRLILLLALIVICFIFAAVFVKQKNEKTEKKYILNDFAMGTAVSIELYGKADELKKAAADISDKIKQLDEDIISWREPDSEISKLNRDYEAGKAYELSAFLTEALDMSLKLCSETDGALDITIRNLANLWNIENAAPEDFKIPEDEEIQDIIENKTGYENVQLNDGKITIKKAGLILDLGAVGKGYALDYIRDYIDTAECDGAVISVGGSIFVYGSKPDKSDWRIGIRDPKGARNEILGYVILKPESNLCVSTSGDYEKYIEKDGRRYHHILDRNTGYPADGKTASVTVICKNGLISDGLSTACFILGSEKSKPILKKYEACAVFIDSDNNVEIVGDISFVRK